MANNRVNVTVGLMTDKTGLKELENALETISREAKDPAQALNKGMQEAAGTARQLLEILNKSYSKDLGTVNISKFNQELSKTKLTLQDVQKGLSGAGNLGATSFNRLGSSILGTNLKIKETNKLLDEMATSMANTVKWGITSSIFNTVTNSIKKAYDYSVDLDKSLNNIRVVTNKSKEEMQDFAVAANNAAKGLGASTLAYSDAALIYYQQGLTDAEAKARAEVTIKAANTAGVTGEAMSEYLTSVWNGYKVTAQEAELYVDKLAAVAADTGADLQELSVGMSKVASAANSMGVDIDQLNAQMATIITVTRQAPESVGTALKTIYARMTDIESGITEDGVTLGNYTEQMAEMGINVLDTQGKLRDMGDVIEEIGGKWEGYSREQQIAMAQVMAGTRQYNNLIALFDSWDMYGAALETSANSLGTLQQQQDIYMESTEAKLKQLTATWQDLYGSLIDNDILNLAIDGLANLVQTFDNFVDSFGGGLGGLAALGTQVANIFKKQIGNAVTDGIRSLTEYNRNISTLQLKLEATKANIATADPNSKDYLSEYGSQVNYQTQIEYAKQIQTIQAGITQEKYNELTTMQKTIAAAQEEVEVLKEKTKLSAEKALGESGYKDLLKRMENESDFDINTDYQERVREEEKLLKIVEEQARKVREIIELQNTGNKQAKQAQQLQSKIATITSQINTEESKQLKNILKEYDFTNLTSKQRQKILDLLNKVESKQKNTAKRTQEEANAVYEVVEARLQQEEIEKRINNNRRNFNTIFDEEKEKAKINNIVTGVISGVSMITSAWSSVNMLFQTWTDDTASLGDKLTQTLNTAIFLIPSIISSLENLNKVTGGTASLLDIIIARKKAKSLFDQLEIKNISTLSLKKQEALVWEELLNKAKEKGIVANNLSAKSLSNETKELLLNTVATKAQVNALQGATSASKLFSSSLLANPIIGALGAIAGAIGLLGGAIATINAIHEASQEAFDTTYDNSTSRIQELEQEAEANQKLYETMMNLHSTYQQGITAREDMADAIRNVLAAYGLEGYEIEKLIGNYEALLGVIRQAKGEESKKKFIEIQKDYEDQKEDYEKTVESDPKWGNKNPNVTNTLWTGTATSNISDLESGPIAKLPEVYTVQYHESSQAEEDKIFDYYREMLVSGQLDRFGFRWKYAPDGSAIAEFNKDNSSGYAGFLQWLTDDFIDSLYSNPEFTTEEIKNSNFLKEIQKFAESTEGENVKKYKEIEAEYQDAFAEMHVVSLDKVLNQILPDEFIPGDTLEEKWFYKRSLAKDVLSQTFDENLIPYTDELLSKYIDNYFNEIYATSPDIDIAAFTEKAKNIDKILTARFGDTYALDLAKEDWVDYLANASSAAIQEFLGTDFFANLSATTTYDDFEREFSKIQAKQKAKETLEISKGLSEIIEALEKGEALDLEQQRLLNKVKSDASSAQALKLNYLYPGTDDYLEMLKKVQEDYETEATQDAIAYLTRLKEDLVKDFADSSGNLLITEDNILEFEKRMDEIQKASYEITVSIEADFSDDFEDFSKILDTYHSGAQMIQEDFKVDADQVEELNSLYPGIIAGAKDLQNGLIQLDREVVEEYVKNAKNKALMSQKAQKEKINELKTAAQTEMEYAETMMKVAEEMSTKGEANISLQKTMTTSLYAYQEKIAKSTNKEVLKDNQETLAEIEEDNEKFGQEDIAKNRARLENNINTERNIAQAGQLSNDVRIGSITFTEADPKFQQLKTLKFTPNYTTKSILNTAREEIDRKWQEEHAGPIQKPGGSVSNNTNNSNNTENTDNSDNIGGDDYNIEPKDLIDWNQMASEWASIYNHYFNLFNSLSGMELELDARTSELLNRYNNILKGLGGKTSLELDKDGNKNKETLDDLESLITNYHDIEIELKQIETLLEKLQIAQEKAFGDQLLKNYNEQIKLLERRAELIAEKIQIAKDIDIPDRKAFLSASLDFPFEFNPDNTIANYQEWYLGRIQPLQDAYLEYQKTKSEDLIKVMNELDDALQKDLKTIEEYENFILETIPEWEKTKADALNEIIEKKIEKFNLEIEVRLDMKEAESNFADFMKNVVWDIDEDDIIGNLEHGDLQLLGSYFNEDREGAIQKQTQQVRDILFELSKIDQGMESIFYGDDKEAAFTDLTEKLGTLMDTMEEYKELQDQIRESYKNMMEEADEAFGKQIDVYEQVGELLNNNREIVELVYGEDSYKKLASFYDQLHANNRTQLDMLNAETEFWRKEMDKEEIGSERYELAKEKWMESIAETRDFAVQAAQDARDKFINMINLIFDELNDKVTDGFGLEYVNEEWELINKNSDQYLDTINSLYGIQDVENKYLNAIDETDNIAAQRKLKEIMDEEIAALEEKDKLTQYDVDRALKKYEITMKQIALEEAQQNKTSMRLKRDSQGNYSYQFVADDEEVAKAEEELAALQNELYNFDLEHYRDNLDQIYSAWEEYQEKMAEAAQINDPEERAARELLINEQYGSLINGLVAQNETIRMNLHESAFDELARLKDQDVELYRKMSEAERDILLNEMIPQWDSGVQKMADIFKTGFEEVCKPALDKLAEATTQYGEDLEDVEQDANMTFSSIFEQEDKVITQTQKLALANEKMDLTQQNLWRSNQKLIDSYKERLTVTQQLIDQMEQFHVNNEDDWIRGENTVVDGNNYTNSQNDLRADNFSDDRDYSLAMTQVVVQGYKGGLEGDYYDSLEFDRDQKIKRDGSVTSVDSKRLRKLFKDYLAGDPIAVSIVMEVYNGNASYTNDWLEPLGYDTGGYTGNWLGEGRLATLHQKELVLNAKDTENMLSAVQVLRNITNTIGNNVLRKVANMTNSIGAPNNNKLEKSDILEQNVHIDAQFPGVKDSKEIENALNNLMNTASQRMLRK